MRSRLRGASGLLVAWRYEDSNPAPAVCKTAALPDELYPLAWWPLLADASSLNNSQWTVATRQ